MSSIQQRRPFGAIAVALLVSGSLLGQEVPAENEAPGKKQNSPTANWHQNADCRLVFFATLEGLYEDGIPNDVVDLVLGRDSKLSNGVKHDFVFRCELCHAVYDAFALYRQRPRFNGSEADTFKAGAIDATLRKRLSSEVARTRVFAMGELVQPWVKRKLLALNISDEDKKELMVRLMSLVSKGISLGRKALMTDPEYKGWPGYGGCQACEAVKTVSTMIYENKKKK